MNVYYVKIKFRTKEDLGEWSTTVHAKDMNAARAAGLRELREQRNDVARVDTVEVR